VLSWYRVDGQYTSHPYAVKALEALSYARFQVPVSTRFYLAFPEKPGDSQAGPTQGFVNETLGSIEQSLEELQ
jgi:hypothetical protein